MSGETTKQQRDERWREGSDVYQHTYAFHHRVLPTAQRTPDADDEADALYYYARVNEAADRKLAEALRRGAARIRALEAALFAKQTPTEGKPE
jgi:hypothetical protein